MFTERNIRGRALGVAVQKGQPCNNKYAVWRAETDPGTCGCWCAVERKFCMKANSWRYLQTNFKQSHTLLSKHKFEGISVCFHTGKKMFWYRSFRSCQFLSLVLSVALDKKVLTTEPLEDLASMENSIWTVFWGVGGTWLLTGQKYKISMFVLTRQTVRKSLSLTCNRAPDCQIQQRRDRMTCHCTTDNASGESAMR